MLYLHHRSEQDPRRVALHLSRGSHTKPICGRKLTIIAVYDLEDPDEEIPDVEVCKQCQTRYEDEPSGARINVAWYWCDDHMREEHRDDRCEDTEVA